MAVQKPVDLTIRLKEETYSIVEIPCESSAVVKAAKETFSNGGSVDMQAFANDLGQVGKFLRVAFNGIMAAGPDYTDFQIRVRKIGNEVTDLCDSSAMTVAEFNLASESVLLDLQSSYQFLLDGMDEVAVETFSNIAAVCEKMENAATKLADDFDKEQKTVEETCTEAMTERGKRAKNIEQIKADRKKQEMKKERELEKSKEALRLEQEAESLRNQYQAKEDESLANPRPVRRWYSYLWVFVGVRYYQEDTSEAWRKKKAEQLKIVNEKREERRKALEAYAQCAMELEDLSMKKEEMNVYAEKGLHSAQEGLGRLSRTMRQAAQFWNLMRQHVQHLASPSVRTQLEIAIDKYDDAKRMSMWTSRPFKQAAIQHYAKWVALQGVCKAYAEHIKVSRKHLYDFLVDNPTYEEARERIPQLVADLRKEVDQATKDIDQQKLETSIQIQELEEAEAGEGEGAEP